MKTLISKLIITITLLTLINGCKEEAISPIKNEQRPEAKLSLSRLVTESYPSPVDSSAVVYCPKFIYWGRPFHIGDTLAVVVSQELGAQIIGDKNVSVTVTSKLGDNESYILKGGSWPCFTHASDISTYQAIIFYNTKSLGNPPHAFPNNGELEIKTTGDTLIASYLSYSTGKTLYDTVAVVPK